MRVSPVNMGYFILGIGLILFMGLYMIYTGQKKKEDFNQIKGRVTYYAKSYKDFPKVHIGKERYLMVDGHPEVFEIFIGSDKGDFSPEFQILDKLKIGDTISLYYADPYPLQNSGGKPEEMNVYARFIDKGKTPYYIKGAHDKIAGNVLVIGGVLIAGFLYLFRHKL